METKKWEDCPRNDLHTIPQMESLGYTIKFNYKDVRYDRITPQNVPHEPVSFEKENYMIWKCMKRFSDGDIIYGWQTAYIIGGHFIDHIWFATLKECVKRNEKTEI